MEGDGERTEKFDIVEAFIDYIDFSSFGLLPVQFQFQAKRMTGLHITDRDDQCQALHPI